MALVKVKLPPGMYRNGTKYQSYGRWYDGNGVRWVDGSIQPIGGWKPVTDGTTSATQITVSGSARAMLAWLANSGSAYLAVGTHTKLYTFVEGTLNDVTPTTPAAFTTGRATTTFTAGGYGIGTYGAGTYGSVDSTLTLRQEASVWQLDNYGEDLVGVVATDGRIWYWDRSAGGEAGVIDASAPTSCTGVVVTPERFIVALGAGGDPRKVQWASQETTGTWTATSTNTAGSYILETKGKLMCGRRGRTETLIWTDADLWVLRYIGGTLVYARERVGDQCGIIARNAVAMVGGAVAFWMGRRGFFMYDGFVRPVPCDVADYLFTRLNDDQRELVYATTRAEYGEVWWYYPANASQENTSYVVYNYREQHWYFGELARTADVDHTPFNHPVAVDTTGKLWHHEWGTTRTGMTPYLESGPYELGDGTKLQQVLAVYPDETTLGDVTATIYAATYPTATESSQSVTLANPTDVRLTGRQVRIRLTEASAGNWRVGDMRLKTVPAGER